MVLSLVLLVLCCVVCLLLLLCCSGGCVKSLYSVSALLLNKCCFRCVWACVCVFFCVELMFDVCVYIYIVIFCLGGLCGYVMCFWGGVFSLCVRLLLILAVSVVFGRLFLFFLLFCACF